MTLNTRKADTQKFPNVMSVTVIGDVMNHSKVLTNNTCHWYYYYYVIRSCVVCHGGSHASGACFNGNLHTKFIVHDHYSLTWPTSVFVRRCGLNLADAVMQRSMSHFGRCRYCYSGALLSGSGHCCPFLVRSPVNFLHRRPIIGFRGFVFCQRCKGYRRGGLNMPRCNL